MAAKETFTKEQGLEVIREMIMTSRQNYSEMAIHYLIWGWAILVAALAQYVMLVSDIQFNSLFIWVPVIVIAAGASVINSYKIADKKQSTTFIDYSLAGLWASSTGIYVILLLVGLQYNWVVVYPMIIASYGWGIITSGVLLKFRPMIYGGIANFIIAGVAVFVASYEIILLLILSLIVSFIIPGYMLKSRK